MKTAIEREQWLFELDESLLQGGIILPEFVVWLTKESDTCFINECYLASIILSVSCIETLLKADFFSEEVQSSLYQLISEADFDMQMSKDLHLVRKFRNSWVHIKNPWKDEVLLNTPDLVDQEVYEMAKMTIHLQRKIMYSNQFI